MSAGLSVMGTGMKVISSLMAGQSGSNAAKAEANRLRREAEYQQLRTGISLKLLEDKRGFDQAQLDRGLILQRREIRKAAVRTAGAQRAGMAKAGVDVSAGGSPMDLLTETAAKADYDQRIASYNRTVAGILTDYEADMNAISIRMQSNFEQSVARQNIRAAQSKADASIMAGIMGAAGAVMGGITDYLSIKQAASPGNYAETGSGSNLGAGNSFLIQ